MNTEEIKNNEAPNEEPKAEAPKEASRTKPSIWTKAKENINVVLPICVATFVLLFAIVNISSLSGIFTSVASVLTPILMGAAFAYLLNPILMIYELKVFHKMKNKNAIRALSITMTYVTAALILVAFAFLLIPQLVKSISMLRFDVYISTATAYINKLINLIFGNSDIEEVVDKQSLLNFVSKLLSGSGNFLENVSAYVLEYGAGLFAGVKNTVLAFFISIYVLISKERLIAQGKKFVTAVLPRETTKRLYRYVTLAHQTFSRYLVGMIIDALFVGILTLIFMLIFRIPSALLVATIVACTNVIPVFGPFIGAIPSFIIIFIESPIKALIFLVLVVVIQQIDGNIIAPKILGNSTGLSSLGVIVSIIIMSKYMGLIGMVLGVPIFSVIVTIVKEFLEDKLKSRNLPTDTAEYYASNSLVDPHEQKETFWVFIAKHINPSIHAFAIKKHQNKQEKKKAKKEQEENKNGKENTNSHE